MGFYTSLATQNAISAVTVGEWLLLFLAWPLTRILKNRIDMKKLAYLYMAGVSGAFYTPLIGDLFLHVVGNRVQRLSLEDSLRFYAWFMAPSQQTVLDLMKGGISFPTAEWFPVLAFWWILTLMPSLLLIGIVTLFRRQWLDVEHVPFPLTMVSYELLKRIPASQGMTQQRRWWSPFILGLMVGIVFQALVSMTQLFPWFPDIFAIRGNCCGFVWYVKAGTSFAPIIGLGTANLQPLMSAVAYFIPLSISFNSWFWYLVYLVLMQIAFAMGYYTGADTAGGCGRGWCGGYSGLFSPPFNFMSISEAGGLVGLTIFSLFISRRYLLETFKAAFSKMKGGSPAEIESKEAISYKSTWLLILLGFIGTMAVFMVAGVSAWPAFLMPITYLVYFYANMRLYGLSGGYMRGMEHSHALEKLLAFPTKPTPYTGEFMIVAPFTESELDICSGRLFGASDGAFASFRMADLVGINNRNTFKALMVMAIIIPVVSMFAWVWFIGIASFPVLMRFNNNWGQGDR